MATKTLIEQNSVKDRVRIREIFLFTLSRDLFMVPSIVLQISSYGVQIQQVLPYLLFPLTLIERLKMLSSITRVEPESPSYP